MHVLRRGSYIEVSLKVVSLGRRLPSKSRRRRTKDELFDDFGKVFLCRPIYFHDSGIPELVILFKFPQFR